MFINKSRVVYIFVPFRTIYDESCRKSKLLNIYKIKLKIVKTFGKFFQAIENDYINIW